MHVCMYDNDAVNTSISNLSIPIAQAPLIFWDNLDEVAEDPVRMSLMRSMRRHLLDYTMRWRG